MPRTKVLIASRVFSVAAPRIWYSLPPDATISESVALFRMRLAQLTNTRHFFRAYESIFAY